MLLARKGGKWIVAVVRRQFTQVRPNEGATLENIGPTNSSNVGTSYTL